MLNQLVGQFLQSADGVDVLEGLKAQGLSAQQATQAVHATAEWVCVLFGQKSPEVDAKPSKYGAVVPVRQMRP